MAMLIFDDASTRVPLRVDRFSRRWTTAYTIIKLNDTQKTTWQPVASVNKQTKSPKDEKQAGPA